MSITSALTTASSGLSASSRGAEVVAGNIANAGTEGYARRELRLGTMSFGLGGAQVRILGVERHSDPIVVADRRVASAASLEGEARAGMYATLEASIGTPGDAGSLSARLAALDGALITAVGQPESLPKLSQVATSAVDVASLMRDVASGIQQQRLRADQAIAADVSTLNASLQQVHELNLQIRSLSGQNRDASGLIDQRARLIDDVSQIIPLREISRDRNEVALYSTSGLVLLDGQPSQLDFVPTPVVGAAMTREGGALSGLAMHDQEVAVDGAFSMIAGGSLAAAFAIRDTLGPEQADALDLLAADLVQRLADPAVDPTADPAVGGLFTDPGPLAPPQVDLGLAGRIQVNAAVDPEQGGALWRIRAGVGAATEGNPGDAGLLNRMVAALSAARVPDGAAADVPARSLTGHASDVISSVSSRRIVEESRASFSAARESSLRQIEAENGVDTDQEIQILLRIEKQYAANARVLSAVDQMLGRLMEL